MTTNSDPLKEAIMTPQLISKHPQVGTNIFTVMSGLAAEVGAVNLGQGFPDFECDPVLVNAVTQAMQEGRNQYPPMPGVLPLREAVSQKIETLYQHHYDAQSEITVTAGATQALLTIMLAVVHPGDEVIVLEPCYDCYVPNVEMAGGVVVRVPLTPGTFKPDFDRIQAINVRSSFLLCQAAAKEMVKQGDGGSIIVITSRGWSRPRPGTSAYAISKAGQHALAHIAAIELAEFGIRVNEVVPGPIETEMNRVLRESAQDFSALTDGILLKRFGLPKDIAKMVLFLVSPDADFITGSSFRVDGGISVP